MQLTVTNTLADYAAALVRFFTIASECIVLTSVPPSITLQPMHHLKGLLFLARFPTKDLHI
jgi:hypothetical protein